MNEYKKIKKLEGLNIIDKIIMRIFKRYTVKIYVKGAKRGYDWNC